MVAACSSDFQRAPGLGLPRNIGKIRHDAHCVIIFITGISAGRVVVQGEFLGVRTEVVGEPGESPVSPDVSPRNQRCLGDVCFGYDIYGFRCVKNLPTK